MVFNEAVSLNLAFWSGFSGSWTDVSWLRKDAICKTSFTRVWGSKLQKKIFPENQLYWLMPYNGIFFTLLSKTSMDHTISLMVKRMESLFLKILGHGNKYLIGKMTVWNKTVSKKSNNFSFEWRNKVILLMYFSFEWRNKLILLM